MKITDFEMMDTEHPKGVQAILAFGDHLELSVVQNEASYGNKMGLYEIGIFKDGDMVELPGITNEGDTIKGFLSEEEVNAIMLKMYSITGKEPVQV